MVVETLIRSCIRTSHPPCVCKSGIAFTWLILYQNLVIGFIRISMSQNLLYLRIKRGCIIKVFKSELYQGRQKV